MLTESNLPYDFDHTLGNIIEVIQESEGYRVGAEVEIIIVH